MRLGVLLAVALSSGACQGSDAVTGTGTSSDTGVVDSSSSGPTASITVTESSSGATTSADTTCDEACATTSGATTTATTTGAETGTSSTSDTGVESSSGAIESSSEGPGGVCGNGIVEGNEDCDDSGESATCDANCTDAMCGDATHNATAGEACDAGGESFVCDVDCTLPVCGDGLTNASINELCDDGGPSPTCDPDCTSVSCGDGTQNIAALETCDDGDNMSGDGCSATCVIEGDFGGQCRIVDGTQWCFDDDNCGEACNDVCANLGLTIEPDDMAWFAAQDSIPECQAISDAFGMSAAIDFGDYPLACLEDSGLDDLTGGGLTGGLRCSSDPACPAAHRTDMDDLGTICDVVGARRSVCPCEGPFCGNALIEVGEDCDDGNQINNDGCTTGCLTTPPSCVEVDGLFWCYDPDTCGEACNDVCSALGLSLDIGDVEWSAAQDTLAECQAIADALGMDFADANQYTYACAEEEGFDDVLGQGLSGTLYCSTDPMCPSLHRTQMDSLGLPCNQMSSFRSICPCN
jgi:cysteine-rich repeat protein